MIVFDLQCEKGHAFEGWFEDNQAYDGQKRKGGSNSRGLCPLGLKSSATDAMNTTANSPPTTQ